MDELLRRIKLENELCAPYAKEVEEFRSGPNDVIISTPPKCGTTWLMQILHQLRTGGDEDFLNLYDEVPFLCSGCVAFGFPLNVVQKGAPLRVFKSHIPVSALLADPNQGKVVWCLRRPEDAMLSSYHFFPEAYGLKEPVSMQEFTEKIVLDFNILAFPNYWSMVVDWYKNRNNLRLCSLFYEDLHKNTAACVEKIAAFLGISLNEQKLQCVLHMSSFAYMKQHSSKFNDQELCTRFFKKAGLPEHKFEHGIIRRGLTSEGIQRLPQQTVANLNDAWAKFVTPEIGFQTYDSLLQAESMFCKQQ